MHKGLVFALGLVVVAAALASSTTGQHASLESIESEMDPAQIISVLETCSSLIQAQAAQVDALQARVSHLEAMVHSLVVTSAATQLSQLIFDQKEKSAQTLNITGLAPSHS